MTNEELINALRAELAERDKVTAAAAIEADRVRAAIAVLDDTPTELIVVPLDVVEPKPKPGATVACSHCGDQVDKRGIRAHERSHQAKAATSTKREAAARRVAARATCEHCGREFSSMGIGTHKARCKAKPTFGSIDVRAGKPLPPLSSVPDLHDVDDQPPRPTSTTPPQVAGKHFECGQDDCDATFPTTRELTHHTIYTHNRPPKADERVPVPA